jgi:hypothetical protein
MMSRIFLKNTKNKVSGFGLQVNRQTSLSDKLLRKFY